MADEEYIFPNFLAPEYFWFQKLWNTPRQPTRMYTYYTFNVTLSRESEVSRLVKNEAERNRSYFARLK
jgi:hypothetical protein